MEISHLLEPIRINVARNYLKREFYKLFYQNHDPRFVKDLFVSIDSLNPNDMGIRDFWNIVWGVAMGYKLKITLLDIITAENVEWKLERSFSVNKLRTGGSLIYIDKVLQSPQSHSGLLKFFRDNPDKAKYWKDQLDRSDVGAVSGDNFPIIAEDKGKYYSIHDGNRRFILSAIDNKNKMKVFIASYKTKKNQPINYWIPTPILMELVYYLKRSEKEEVFDSYVTVLKDIVTNSDLGREELFKRVIDRDSKFFKSIRDKI